MALDNESMRILRELDEGTDWSVDGDMLAANDPKQEGGDSSVATVSSDMEPGGLDGPETVENILSCVSDMKEHGIIEDVVVVVNTVKQDQLLSTTIERNDLIIGCLEVAKMNWHNSQIALQNEVEGGDE